MNVWFSCFSRAQAPASGKCSWYWQWPDSPGKKSLVSMSLSVLTCDTLRLVPNSKVMRWEHVWNTEHRAAPLGVVQGRPWPREKLYPKSVLLGIWGRRAQSLSMTRVVLQLTQRAKANTRGFLYFRSKFWCSCFVGVHFWFCSWVFFGLL